jgi:hypothetical protein
LEILRQRVRHYNSEDFPYHIVVMLDILHDTRKRSFGQSTKVLSVPGVITGPSALYQVAYKGAARMKPDGKGA